MIRESISECLSLTEQLVKALDGVATDKDRLEVMELVNKLLLSRQELIPSIQAPYSEEETAVGKQIVTMNQSIDTKLSEWKLAVQRDLNGFTKKKTSITKYADPYRNVQFDGMFYDKKK